MLKDREKNDMKLNFWAFTEKAKKFIMWILVTQLIGLHIFLPINLFSQENQKKKEAARSEIINLTENSKTSTNSSKSFALIIGVDKYEDVGNLSGAVNDAELLEKTLITHA
jgi:uncharacterized membrane protein